MTAACGRPEPRRCAVLGSPIEHSLSPALHRAAYAEAGLGWSYGAYEVGEAGLADFLDGVLDETWRGLSLTMPLKRAVVPLADTVSERVRMAGAANTLVLGEGGRHAHNTDIPGAVAAIRERTAMPLSRAVVVGGGATAASVVLALADLGCAEVALAVRDEGRAAPTLQAVRRHPAAPEVRVVGLGAGLVVGLGGGPGGGLGAGPAAADILVSTIPASAQASPVVELAGSTPVVFDVVYDPWPTPLARAALAAGRTLVSGLDLLVHQAALQFTLMTGLPDPPVAAMRAAGERALAGRAAG